MLVSAHPTRHTLLRLPHTRLAALRALASRAAAQKGMADTAAASAASGGAGAAPAPAHTSAAHHASAALGDGSRPKVLILTGPTAVGKTKASLALAAELGGEIISADSVQVYRGLDIGSDKARSRACRQADSARNPFAEAVREHHIERAALMPHRRRLPCLLTWVLARRVVLASAMSVPPLPPCCRSRPRWRTPQIRPEERQGIPHHLLDVLDPSEDFSAGDFFVAARRAAEDILQVRKRRTLLTLRLENSPRSFIFTQAACRRTRNPASKRRRAPLPQLALTTSLPVGLVPVQRGKVPIVVGGTGFYLRWFIHGKPNTPVATAASEAVAAARLEQVGTCRVMQASQECILLAADAVERDAPAMWLWYRNADIQAKHPCAGVRRSGGGQGRR